MVKFTCTGQLGKFDHVDILRSALVFVQPHVTYGEFACTNFGLDGSNGNARSLAKFFHRYEGRIYLNCKAHGVSSLVVYVLRLLRQLVRAGCYQRKLARVNRRIGDLVEIVDRIRKIREAEGLSQDAFSKETGINFGSLRNYEGGRRKSIGSEQLAKITEHPRFKKYALWLVTGETAPESGQISPEIEQERNAG